ncbi:Sedlin [Dunaliella salina]|uniref:Trafficking protein particle complex subunit 2-like protein n=1 Tax=Dunaliella salina TaxID=3046 RepID=A0ABQ7GBC4_DUNSA|nr:Sedlin [Dunaliella salina]|eukprot:KAF5831918.1 Sedlin [Dunaliella salina]
MSKLNIVCVAVVGQQNQPLYIKAFGEDVDGHLLLKLHHVVHCSLDALEERVLMKVPANSGGAYLGLLYPTPHFKVYGYLSNTATKFFIILDHNPLRDDSVIAKAFKKIHGLYADTTSNPFHEFNLPLRSPRFDAVVSTLVAAYNNQPTQEQALA